MDNLKQCHRVHVFFSKIFKCDFKNIPIIIQKSDFFHGKFENGQIIINDRLLSQEKRKTLFRVLIHEFTHAKQYIKSKTELKISIEDYEREALNNEKSYFRYYHDFRDFLEGRLHKNEFLHTQRPLCNSNKIDFFPTLYSLGIEIEIHGIIVGTVTQIGSYGYIQFSIPRVTYDSKSHPVNVPGNDVGCDIPILQIHEIDFILKITLDHASMSFKNSSGGISEYSYSCFELVTTPLRYRQPPQAIVNRMKRMIALTAEIISSTADTSFLQINI